MAKEMNNLEDIIKKQYSYLYELNQRLKNICSCYYISHAGYIYLKSLNNFSEILIELRYPENVDRFNGSLILPNAFFDFGKKAKKTKLTITESLEDDEFGIRLGQIDDSELNYLVNIVNPDYKKDEKYVQERIVPEMYKRFFKLSDPNFYKQYPSEDIEYIRISDEDYKDMLNAKEKLIPYNGTILIFTKQLFADGKKNDLLEFKKLCYESIEDSLYRVFYILKHECDIYTSYTIFSVPQSI